MITLHMLEKLFKLTCTSTRKKNPPSPGDPLTLRLLLDGSALEIFTGGGEALTTRVYQGHPPEPPTHSAASAGVTGTGDGGAYDPEADCGGAPLSGVCLFASGAPCVVSHVEAYEMGSCWRAGGGGGEGEEAAAAPAPAPVVRSAWLHHLNISA